MMKKSQILAAIALAMALGVVAPIASVYAEDPADDGDTEDVTPAVGPSASVVKTAKDTITSAKNSFGKVELDNGDKVDGYTEYGIADGLIDDANGVVTEAKKATGSVTTTLKKSVGDAIKGITLGEANTEAMESEAWTAGTYDQVAKIAADIYDELSKKTGTSAEETAAKTASETIKTALETAKTGLDNAVKTDAELATGSKVKALAGELVKLVGGEAAAPKTVAELNTLIGKVEAALPQMKRFRAVEIAIDKLEDAIEEGSTATNDAVKKLIEALEAAVAGTGNGTNIPGSNGSDVNAPATGIAGTAEGTATTVSIVAGLATALTALGAGVVAYRSARRK